MRSFFLYHRGFSQALRTLGWAFLLSALGLVVGCQSGSPGTTTNATGTTTRPSGAQTEFVDNLRNGDMVEVTFSGNPTAPEDVEERIKEGKINLPLIGEVEAAGKTAGQLQADIQGKYVPQYFRRLTVTIRTENRVFFVDGEVRRPDRYVYTGELTVLKAIAAAGGFTDFAAKGRIELIRGQSKFRIDGNKAKDRPELDLVVIPGDRVVVPRRSPFGS